MEIDYKSIGERTRHFRGAMQITQAALAEKSGVEPSNISHIERGATKVSLPTLVKIANALGASLDDLVLGSLYKTRHVSVKELNGLLEDCTDGEIKSIVELVKNAKPLFRK